MVWTWRRLHIGGDIWAGLGRILRQAVKPRRETCMFKRYLLVRRVREYQERKCKSDYVTLLLKAPQ